MTTVAVRIRLIAAAGIVLTIAIGLGVRKYVGGVVGEHLGNVAWGVMWVLIGYAFTLRARLAAIGGLVVVVAIECFQLTPYPAAWSSESVVARYALGGAFEVRDLVGSAIGVAAAWFAIARFVQGR